MLEQSIRRVFAVGDDPIRMAERETHRPGTCGRVPNP